MDNVELVILVIAVTIEFVVGISLNICILLVYIGNLKNGVSLGPSDKVHLTKALVNVSLHLMMGEQCIISITWPQLSLTNEVLGWNLAINMFLIFYSYWLTAVLCGYYCTNITTCGHQIFVWLKRSLSSHLLHIILVEGLGSFAIGFPTYWFCNTEPPGNSTHQSVVIQSTSHFNVSYRSISSILGCFLPLTIALVATAFTSWSLLKHMWRLRQNNRGFTWSKFQAQINATRTMILFLLVSLFYCVTQMAFTAIQPSAVQDANIVIWFVILSYPISEAAIIIQSSVRLRSALLEKVFGRKRRNGEAET
ncbi:taste receptor type 2 member 40-like [Dendropsophus ebraccatus]|uniref:taste receptor type 2 member 40-like n=1 Tax=Dendropsophus ebraccatus TaxID=150705 RepID=UPI0038313C27